MHRFGKQIKTEHLWSIVAAWVCLYNLLLLISAKSGNNWDNWYLFWHLFWWNYKLFKLNLTYRILLRWICAIKREGNNTVGKFRLNILEISIVVLHAFLTFHTSAPNWIKVSESISGGLIYYKNEPFRWFKNSFETLLISISTALLWSAVIFLLVYWVVFLTNCCWPSTDEKQTWKHGAIPTLILDTHVTVIYRSLASVLDCNTCQESLFPL